VPKLLLQVIQLFPETGRKFIRRSKLGALFDKIIPSNLATWLFLACSSFLVFVTGLNLFANPSDTLPGFMVNVVPPLRISLSVYKIYVLYGNRDKLKRILSDALTEIPFPPILRPEVDAYKMDLGKKSWALIALTAFSTLHTVPSLVWTFVESIRTSGNLKNIEIWLPFGLDRFHILSGEKYFNTLRDSNCTVSPFIEKIVMI